MVARFLPNIIHESQIGFIRSRCIFDNVVLLWDVMALVDRSMPSSAIMLVDFEKAYDIVLWPFLENVM